MAITAASFVPERRGAGGPASPAGAPHGNSAAAHGSPVHGEGYNHATDSAQAAAHESQPANHPVTGTPLPKGTGAGAGTIRRGGRGGK